MVLLRAALYNLILVLHKDVIGNIQLVLNKCKEQTLQLILQIVSDKEEEFLAFSPEELGKQRIPA